MATASQQKAYYAKMLPYGKKVTQKIGIPANTVVAWWSWETDYGTNSSSKANNHAGIKKNSSGADYAAGAYAGYNTLDSFVNDYCRILSIGAYGYPAVIKAGATGDTVAITKAHNASSWSEDDYNIDTILSRAKAILGVAPGKPTAPTPPATAAAVCPHCQGAVSLQKA